MNDLMKVISAALMIVLAVLLVVSWQLWRYTEVCSVEDCAAMREALREANELLVQKKHLEHELEGLKRAHDLTLGDNVAMYEQLVSCRCPPERWRTDAK